MAYITLTSGLTIQVPTRGTRNWADTVLNQNFKKISEHDHTGSGKGLQIGTNAISADAVTDAKIRLRNNQYLRARNAANSADVNLLRLNSSDVLEFVSPIQGLFFWGGTTGGTANAQTATMAPVPTSYVTGSVYHVLIGSGLTNTGAMTLNFNALGVKNVKKINGLDPIAGDVIAGGVYKFLYDGTNLVLLGNVADRILSRSTADVNVSGTTSETDLLSVSIPGGLLGTARGVRTLLQGYANNNTGSDKTFTFRFKFGSATVMSYAGTIATNAQSFPFEMHFDVFADGATNSQSCFAKFEAAQPGAGLAPLTQTTSVANWNSAAQDTTSAKTLAISIEMSSAGCQTVQKHSIIEYV